MERRAKSWLAMLERGLQTMQEWCRMQQELRLLSPIFRSDRLAPALPEINRKLASVENAWLKILKTAHQSSKVTTILVVERLGESIHELYSIVLAIKASLDPYLDSVCQRFPRLWFLSRVELIQMLSRNEQLPQTERLRAPRLLLCLASPPPLPSLLHCGWACCARESPLNSSLAVTW
jgi:hypothetical protein